MLSNIEMHDAAALVSQHDEHEEHPAFDGRHGEKITGYDVFNVIAQKGFPCV
jgi:hypothetical protein